jgi:hypothetical protein
MPKVVWLASYPKSGNTWMRTFLWALQNKGPINLNRLSTGGIFSAKNILEQAMDVNPDWLMPAEIDRYQRIAYQHHFGEVVQQRIVKIHDAYTISEWDGLPRIPVSPDHLVVYIVRNPIDVVPSFANHSSKDYDSIINKSLNNPKGGLSTKAAWGNQFAQPMGTWSMHVESWLSQEVAPVLLVRYEDMKSDPFNTFKGVVSAMELIYTDNEIQHAIERTRFETIKELEEKQGFREKANPDSSFFFHGRVGRGKEVLSPEQVDRVISIHSEMMKKLGYL